MNTDSVNKWLTLAANIGVLAGIIFLSIEIRQTNRIANTQFLANDLATRTTAYDARIGDSFPEAWSKAVTNSEDISVKDFIVIDAFLSREWMRAMQTRNVLQAGFAQGDLNERAAEWTFQYLGNTTSLNWWEQNQGDNGGLLNQYPEFRDAINNLLETMEPFLDQSQFHQSRYDQMKNSL